MDEEGDDEEQDEPWVKPVLTSEVPDIYLSVIHADKFANVPHSPASTRSSE